MKHSTPTLLAALLLMGVGAAGAQGLDVPDAATDRMVDEVFIGRADNDIGLNDTKRLLSKVIAQEESLKELYAEVMDLEPSSSQRRIGSLIVSINIARTQVDNLSSEGRKLFLGASGQTDPAVAKYSRMMVAYSLRVHRLVRKMRRRVRQIMQGKASIKAFQTKKGRRGKSDLRDAVVSEGFVKRDANKEALGRLIQDANKLQESANHLYSAAKFLSVSAQ